MKQPVLSCARIFGFQTSHRFASQVLRCNHVVELILLALVREVSIMPLRRYIAHQCVQAVRARSPSSAGFAIRHLRWQKISRSTICASVTSKFCVTQNSMHNVCPLYTSMVQNVSALLGRMPSAVGLSATDSFNRNGRACKNELHATSKGAITSAVCPAIYVPADALDRPLLQRGTYLLLTWMRLLFLNDKIRLKKVFTQLM